MSSRSPELVDGRIAECSVLQWGSTSRSPDGRGMQLRHSCSAGDSGLDTLAAVRASGMGGVAAAVSVTLLIASIGGIWIPKVSAFPYVTIGLAATGVAQGLVLGHCDRLCPLRPGSRAKEPEVLPDLGVSPARGRKPCHLSCDSATGLGARPGLWFCPATPHLPGSRPRRRLTDPLDAGADLSRCRVWRCRRATDR